MADFLTSIGDLLGLNKGKPTIAAADSNSGILDQLGPQLEGIINSGDAQSRGYLEKILGLTGMGNGSTLYADALGVNGADGSGRARAAFQTGPGYGFQMDQGLQALDRRAAASGRFSSGNADIDTLKYSQGLADQGWDKWLGNLTGGVDRATGALGDLATLSGNTAGQRYSTAGDLASGRMNINNQTAAGGEAGQGAIWDLLGNVAGVAGSAFGLKPPGMGGGGMPPTATGAGWGGYGRGY
jgi:hypothetical protein